MEPRSYGNSGYIITGGDYRKKPHQTNSKKQLENTHAYGDTINKLEDQFNFSNTNDFEKE